MAKELVERIFAGARGPSDESVDDYEFTVKSMIQDARNYQDDVRAPAREEFLRYYTGEEPALDAEGRSTITSTDVRDTILAMMPSLLRIFTSQEHVVQFVPRTARMVDLAEEAMDYCSYVFMDDNDGFLILHNVFKDALTKGEGITKWWVDEAVEITVSEYSNLDEEAIAMLEADGLEITERTPTDNPVAFNVVARRVDKEPLHRVDAVPPDEFYIDRYARNVRTASLVGHQRVMMAHDLVAMGYDRELVDQHKGTNVAAARWNEERSIRNEGLELGVARSDNVDGVLYGEFYIRVDSDDDGVAELHKICVMGDNDEIVDDEIVAEIPFAYFCPDPEPHTTIGHSISELVMDIQKIKTNLIRNSLDSIAQTIFPRLVFIENMANVDDILNNELGAPIRAKSIEAVQQLQQSFVGDAPMSMINYLDTISIRRTGQSDASKGLDPAALQSTTQKGVSMVITGAQERIELIARILAETGMKDMFKGLLRMVARNPAPNRVVKLRGNWVTPRATEYDVRMGIKVNPAIGKGSDFDRFTMLNQIKMTQEMVLQQLGMDNPLCSLMEYRNTLKDMISIAGFKNDDRYFKQVTPEALAKVAEDAKTARESDPTYILAMNEREKLRLRGVEKIGDNEFREEKLDKDDDFRRDELAVNTILKSTEIGAQAREAEMRAEVERARNNGRTGEDQPVGAGQVPAGQPAVPGVF